MTLPSQNSRPVGASLLSEQQAGRIRTDNHLDPSRTVDQAAADLADAGQAARQLGQLLDAARQHTAHLGARTAGDGAVAGGRSTQRARADRAGTVATGGHIHGHQRAGSVAADGQISMSLDTRARAAFRQRPTCAPIKIGPTFVGSARTHICFT